MAPPLARKWSLCSTCHDLQHIADGDLVMAIIIPLSNISPLLCSSCNRLDGCCCWYDISFRCVVGRMQLSALVTIQHHVRCLLLHSGILWGTVTELLLHYGKAPRLAPAPPCTSDGCARGHPSHLICSLCQIWRAHWTGNIVKPKS